MTAGSGGDHFQSMNILIYLPFFLVCFHFLTSESVCLFVYLATGTLQIYSLPSLRIITELDFQPMSDFRIARTISFRQNGHSLHLNSPTELIKKCLDKSLLPTLTSLRANIFKEGLETPEAPKQGTFASRSFVSALHRCSLLWPAQFSLSHVFKCA